MLDLKKVDVLDRQLLTDPYPFYDRLRREAPVWQVPGLDLYYVSSWRLVAEATGRVEELSSNLNTLVVTGADGRPSLFDTSGFGPGTTTLATSDPPTHTVHRKAVFPELVARQMALMEPMIRSAVSERLDAVEQQRSVEWTSAVANAVPMTVIARIIGFAAADHAQLREWAFSGTDLLAGTKTLDEIGQLVGSSAAAGAYIAAQLDEAIAAPGDNVIGAVARALSEGVLSRDDAIGTLVILLGAGGESTASLIGNAVRLLAEDGDLQAQLRAEPSLIPAFVEEAIRLETPFRGHFRQARREMVLGDVTIPAGATVLLLWAAANRDPDEFDRPNDVVLTRRVAKSHLGFGRGIHFCVGAPLARLEATVAVESLVDRTAHFRLDPERPPAYAHNMFVRRHEHLDLLIEPAARSIS